MKHILNLIENIEVSIDECVDNDSQHNYMKDCLKELLEEIRSKQDKIKQQQQIIINYSEELNRLRFTIKGLGNSYKFLISNIMGD